MPDLSTFLAMQFKCIMHDQQSIYSETEELLSMVSDELCSKKM